jgi:hypothetical protein
MMKKTAFLLVLTTLLAFGASAQKFRGVDKSPRDVAYFPDNFAHDRKDGDKALVKVNYSRPFAKDREIYGKLEPYGKVSRLGADESAEIKLYQDATIGGKKVKAGTYSLFAIPGENEWTIIISSDVDYWGAYKYKEANDVVRVTAPVTNKSNDHVENFSIQFKDAGAKAATMMIGWSTTVVEVPFKF